MWNRKIGAPSLWSRKPKEEGSYESEDKRRRRKYDDGDDRRGNRLQTFPNTTPRTTTTRRRTVTPGTTRKTTSSGRDGGNDDDAWVCLPFTQTICSTIKAAQRNFSRSPRLGKIFVPLTIIPSSCRPSAEPFRRPPRFVLLPSLYLPLYSRIQIPYSGLNPPPFLLTSSSPLF